LKDWRGRVKVTFGIIVVILLAVIMINTIRYNGELKAIQQQLQVLQDEELIPVRPSDEIRFQFGSFGGSNDVLVKDCVGPWLKIEFENGGSRWQNFDNVNWYYVTND